MNKKQHYSYFLIKPDGIRYFKQIREKIESKEFDKVAYYAVKNWEKLQKYLYEEHYASENGAEFAESYQAFIEAEKMLFGNKGIIVLVGSSKESYQDLMEMVYNTKLEIRRELGYKVGLVTIQRNSEDANQVVLIDQKKNIKKAKRFDEEGVRYRVNHLDVIHCPDPTRLATLGELRKLLKQGFIRNKNLISFKLMTNIDKYKSSEFIGDEEYDDGSR